ncbi:hypothetical protein F441_04295 [Phytophthora nicotianae CJ01A1]|uniref:Uncharacterized protein n=1 Tax=Phytophthora nicotianae CJ01A1 TaxID=1317063 RepID=W2XKM5_PHYNI|nr:hypothetical protein F441_04295 [Phytophthora nicotianae CJ01A1]
MCGQRGSSACLANTVCRAGISRVGVDTVHWTAGPDRATGTGKHWRFRCLPHAPCVKLLPGRSILTLRNEDLHSDCLALRYRLIECFSTMSMLLQSRIPHLMPLPLLSLEN